MRIQKLDVETSNRIAAGEVVDRPANVIKELVENALDAGATAITIEFSGGGLESMRVVDNGSGFEKEDMPLAFERHATGKIRSGDSLVGIETLGFRGEALSSIAAVSKVTLQSRTREAEMGSRVLLSGGTVLEQSDIGCPEGTSLLVEDLFFNTPARLKFAKAPAAETAYIGEIVQRLMLANPTVAFRLYNGQRLVMQTPGTDLYDAILAIYGAEVAKQLLPLDSQDGPLSIRGFVGRPEIARATRQGQTLIVNGRAIRNQAISNAVTAGYGERMMVGKFAFFVIELTLPFAAVDVNVHPQKLEVRFTNEADLCARMAAAGHEAWMLAQQQARAAQTPTQPPQAEQTASLSEDDEAYAAPQPPPQTDTAYAKAPSLQQSVEQLREFHPPVQTQGTFLHEPSGLAAALDVYTANGQDEPQAPLSTEGEYLSLGHEYRVIGQLFDTYLLVQAQDSLMMIDQHAAHERLNYDRMMAQAEDKSIPSQTLLKPVLIELSFTEMAHYELMADSFASLGFEIEPFGAQGLVVRAVPLMMIEAPLYRMITTVLDEGENRGNVDLVSLQRERIVRHACRMSIKAGDPLSTQEIDSLLAQLFDNDGLTCPHGRPIAVRIPKRELEKGFKRIV